MAHHEFLTGDRARDQRNVDVLLDAVQQLYGGANLEDLERSAVDSAITVTGGERGILLLRDDSGALAVRVARERPGRDLPLDVIFSRSTAEEAFATGKPKLVYVYRKGAKGWAEWKPTESQQAANLRSVLAVPLPGGEGPVGVLYIDSHATVKGFTPGDLAVFQTLAGLVATAIDLVEGRDTRSEIDLARRIQLGMAPRGVAAPEGFDLAFDGRAAKRTSGDYHDVIPVANRGLCLAIGDVVGKGLGATLHMTSVRAALRTLVRAGGDPLSVFPDLNAYVCGEMASSGGFITLALVLVDPVARTLRWTSAGQPALLWRRGQGRIDLLRTGIPLGLNSPEKYEVKGPIALESGDAVVLWTDGMHDAWNASNEYYDEERFFSSVARHAARDGGARPVLEGVFADLAAHAGGRALYDDSTCIVLRVL